MANSSFFHKDYNLDMVNIIGYPSHSIGFGNFLHIKFCKKGLEKDLDRILNPFFLKDLDRNLDPKNKDLKNLCAYLLNKMSPTQKLMCLNTIL